MIQRSEYLSRLIAWKDRRVVKVVTGIRRCGKSMLFELYQEYLRDIGVEDTQIVAVNFEDFGNFALCEPSALHEYLVTRLHESKPTYIFLDEIQNVPQFERVVNSLLLRSNVDLYITGSNAFLLSSELATFLSGRYITIDMLPLSFSEYVSFTGSKSDLPKKYREYVERGSFPFVTTLGSNMRMIDEYLQAIYSSIVLKDITPRYRITDSMQLESVLKYVYSNIGSLVSTKKIADTMTSDGRKIDVKTVEKYLNAFMNSYFVYQANRYDVKGKQYLKTLEKYYAVDIGLRYAILGRKDYDAGHILENIIYLELLRRGYKVFVGKCGNYEIDFVATDTNNTAYYQVAATVRDPNVLDRELRPLQAVADNYPKIILTLDDDPDSNYNGIQKLNALEWLVNK